MHTISLCMIVKNEEDVIGRCLECVKDLVDEIVIVDTGSTDKTKKIVKNYTDKIYDFKWVDDFAKARNYAFSKATKDYIMWLDADDVIDLENQKKFLKVKKDLVDNIDMVMMKYDVGFDEFDNTTFTFNRERLFKRSKNYKWVGEIHEIIPLIGNIIYSDVAIKHKKTRPNPPERNLKIYERMLLENKILEPRQKFYYARELYYNSKFGKAIEVFNEFLEENLGWIENNINACEILSNCYFKVNNKEKGLNSLFRSFIYDVPRGEICCNIGDYFFRNNEYKKAIFWYKTASDNVIDNSDGRFTLPDCYDFIPFLQLCVCYDRLKDIENAKYYNEKAGQIKSNDKNYLYNKNYFEQLDNKKKEGK